MGNYTDGWTALSHPFGHYMINSAIVVLGSILGNLISCSMAAYAFARLQFRGKKLFFGIMLLTIMLPFHVVIVPQYILFSQIGWVNTFWPLIVPKLLATDAFFVFLMVQFIRGIPKELDEAARIDGAGHPRIFLRVILPLMVPALATTTIFTFIWTWNDFFGALIYLTDPDMFTVPVALRAFVDRSPPPAGARCSRCPSSRCCPCSWCSSSASGSSSRESPPPASSRLAAAWPSRSGGIDRPVRVASGKPTTCNTSKPTCNH